MVFGHKLGYRNQSCPQRVFILACRELVLRAQEHNFSEQTETNVDKSLSMMADVMSSSIVLQMDEIYI